MRKILQLLLMLVIVTCATAQNYSLDWLRTADSYLKSGTMLAKDQDNNVIVTGAAVTSAIYTRKFDKFGNLLWERSSFSGIQSNYETATWVNTDAQNNVFVTGYRYSYSSQAPFNFPNALIVLKYDAQGNLLWKYILEGSYGLTIPLSYSALRFRSETDTGGNLYVGTSGTIAGNTVGGFILLKLNPQGALVWSRTSTAGSPGGFLSMRLGNNQVLLTGSSAGAFGNVATVCFDTTGVEKWRAATPERGGQDIETDNIGNAYILTANYNEVNATSGLDILILKYNSNGAQTARYKYNFANNETGYRLCKTGAGELGISGLGYFGGSFTSDWLVMKINMTTGALLWSRTDVNTSPYDVGATNLTGNSNGELFVTGYKPSGKPFPGTLAMATRKYTADGTPAWTALYDSTASRGTAIVLSGDGSVYALGSAYATVLHYFNHSGTGVCNSPDTATITNITRSSAVINYRKTPGAIVYHIQYKALSSPRWITVSTDKLKYKLSGLAPGTTYQYRIETVCNSRPSGYQAIRQFTTAGAPYCTTGALNASDDYIAYVQLGNFVDGINNSTGSNNGYADFTYLTTKAAAGETVSGSLSASYFAPVFNEYFRVWADFNIDGDFNDPGELVVSTTATSIGSFPVSFTIPANAKAGTTRIRVSMKNGSAPPVCGSYASGETEDYGLIITGNTLPQASFSAGMVSAVHETSTRVFIHPNPARDYVTIRHDLHNNKPVFLKIYNSSGQQVISQILTGNTVNVSRLSGGFYIAQLIQEDQVRKIRLVIQR